LFVQRVSVTVKYACVNLAFLTAYTSNISRQAVHIERFAVFCRLHQLFCTSPVFMLRVLCQKLLLQSLDAVKITVSVKLGTFLHSGERSPALRIYDVSVFKCFSHAVCLCECTA